MNISLPNGKIVKMEKISSAWSRYLRFVGQKKFLRVISGEAAGFSPLIKKEVPVKDLIKHLRRTKMGLEPVFGKTTDPLSVPISDPRRRALYFKRGRKYYKVLGFPTKEKRSLPQIKEIISDIMTRKEDYYPGLWYKRLSGKGESVRFSHFSKAKEIKPPYKSGALLTQAMPPGKISGLFGFLGTKFKSSRAKGMGKRFQFNVPEREVVYGSRISGDLDFRGLPFKAREIFWSPIKLK